MSDHPHLTETQQAGQRLMVGFDGPRLDDTLKFYIDRLKVGGIILFARNLKNPARWRSCAVMPRTMRGNAGSPPFSSA